MIPDDAELALTQRTAEKKNAAALAKVEKRDFDFVILGHSFHSSKFYHIFFGKTVIFTRRSNISIKRMLTAFFSP